MSKKPEWSPDDFQAFLGLLGPEPEDAARTYQRLHRKLQVMFEARPESAMNATELADATLDRVARKARQGAAIEIRDIQAYALTVARYILMEHRKKPKLEALEVDPPDRRVPPDDDPNLKLRCLRRCLGQLTPEDRQLILNYYARDKGDKIRWRQTAAADLNKSDVAFRVHVYRIRRSLERCIERGMKSLSQVTLSRSVPPHI